MKRLLFILILLPAITFSQQQQEDYTIELARKFSKDLFESNGIPFMQPVVQMINATSNSAFYNTAYIPKKVEKPYFKFSVNAMGGIVTDDVRTYSPYMPNEEYTLEGMASAAQLNIADFAKLQDVTTLEELEKLVDLDGMIHYFFLNLMYDGIYGNNAGLIEVPEKAATALGNKKTEFLLPNENLEKLAEDHPLFGVVPEVFQDSILNLFQRFPETFALYPGSAIDVMGAGVPQLEIGSLYGTEALIRYIPPVDLGETVGKFSFWGFGLKHSISQYINNAPFDMAIQAVYQGTSLENTIGVTEAELISDAEIWNFNLHFSKEIKNWFRVYSGISYDMISITSEYTYYLPIEVQWQLGLIEKPNHHPTPGYPGDQNPQVSVLELEDNALKWTIGITKEIGDFTVFADFNMSEFNVFTLGALYTLDFNKFKD
jgi:hypothetical protein